MKIAAVSEDGVTISQHFGRAPFYVVVTVEDGKIVSREQRDKLGHAHFAGEPHAEEAHGADPRGHGFDPGGAKSPRTDGRRDCRLPSLAGARDGRGGLSKHGAGRHPPHRHRHSTIDDAVQAYLAGRILDHTERLH